LQLEVAERIVEAGKGSFEHVATLVLCWVAAGGCKTPSNGSAKQSIYSVTGDRVA